MRPRCSVRYDGPVDGVCMPPAPPVVATNTLLPPPSALARSGDVTRRQLVLVSASWIVRALWAWRYSTRPSLRKWWNDSSK